MQLPYFEPKINRKLLRIGNLRNFKMDVGYWNGWLSVNWLLVNWLLGYWLLVNGY